MPEEFIEQMAALYNAMNDAPREPGAAAEVWDAQRIRERVNALQPRYGMHDYAVAARHDDTGELAALTEVAVDPADPGWGHQVITAVTREHRGHRLGLLLKLAMMELLATTEPQLERIETWNAESNEHMVAVNDALGYAPFGAPGMLDGNAGPNRFRFQRQRALASSRCFLEGTAEVNSRPPGDTVEFDSRTECSDAARSRSDCASGYSIVLQPSRLGN